MAQHLAELARQCQAMSDESLLAYCASAAPNDPALPVAREEAMFRGLTLVEPTQQTPDLAYKGDYVIVARYLNPMDAHIAQACLQSAGLDVMLADANTVQAQSLWTFAMGGVRLLAPLQQVADANEILAALNRGDFALTDDEPVE